MRQGLRWVLWSVCGLLLVASLLWTASRLWGVTDAQRAALEQMRAGWTPAGRNGFAALWTLRRDVPAERQQAVLDADVRTIQAWSPRLVVDREFRSAAADYPDLAPAPEESPRWCSRDTGCLAKVAADVPAYVALVERHARLIARADALLGYDYLKSPLPPRVDMPLPAMSDSYVPATRDALLFVRGRQQEALANACRAIGGWRRYAANSDLLITAMIADGNAMGHGKLFAEMLAALPADAQVPSECDAALVPASPRELSMCTAFTGEFAFMQASMRQMQSAEPGVDVRVPPGLLARLFIDPDASDAMRAEAFAAACGQGVADMLARDIPVQLVEARGWRQRFGCIANMQGCILDDIATPAFGIYAQRRQDTGMKLRLLGTLLWLHRNPQPGASLAERLARRPASLKSPAREIRADADGKRLRIDLYATSKDGDWSQPLAR